MNLYETAMGQRFFNVQLPALINTLKDIAATLSRPAPSAISFPADPRFLTSLYYGEYEADVFKPDKRLTPFNQTVQQKEKALQAFTQRLRAHPRQAQAAHRKGSRRPRDRI